MTKMKGAIGLILTALLINWAYEPLPPLIPRAEPVITARTQATMEEKRENRELAKQYSRALGYTQRERACLVTLWTRESRFDHLAKNRQGSSAYGITQLLRERSSRPEFQILHGLRYIGHRYSGSACSALSFHNRKSWY